MARYQARSATDARSRLALRQEARLDQRAQQELERRQRVGGRRHEVNVGVVSWHGHG